MIRYTALEIHLYLVSCHKACTPCHKACGKNSGTGKQKTGKTGKPPRPGPFIRSYLYVLALTTFNLSRELTSMDLVGVLLWLWTSATIVMRNYS